VDSPSVARAVQTFLWWAVLQGFVILMQNRCCSASRLAGGTAGAKGCVQPLVTSCQQFHAAGERRDRQFACRRHHSLALVYV
jgi:hypothetical protein